MRNYTNNFDKIAAFAVCIFLFAFTFVWAEERVAATPRGVDNPSLAVGLNGIADWSTQHPFINLMKTARPWTGHLTGQWGGMDSDALEDGGFLDQNGWLKSIPAGVTHIETLLLTDQPEDFLSLSGRYRLRYTGQGKIDLTGIARNIRRGDGEIWFDYVPGDGLVGVSISKTDPNQTGDYIRDISVVSQKLIAPYEVGAIFNPAWLEKIENFRMVRFMDWMFTNGSVTETWSDRPIPNDYTYIRRGVPVEIMVELANTVAADPWFNMPHKANDEYMQRFAEYVQLHLSANLKAHAEYSNEMWNFIFPQTIWALAQAEARWGDAAEGDGWIQYAGLRAAEMAQIWTQVFGAEAENRLVNVISTHSGWPGLEEALLMAPLWLAEENGPGRPPAEFFDAYAITGYFGYEMGADELAPEVLKWIEESEVTAENQAKDLGLTGKQKDSFVRTHKFDSANKMAAAILRNGSLKELIESIFTYQAGVAQNHGLDLVMYEGGTHVTGLGPWVENPILSSFFTQFNYSPEMGNLYKQLLEGWRQAGGTVFNVFVDVALPSKWGSWGTLRHLDDINPRFDAVMNFNTGVPVWWESRPADSFTHGGIFYGTPQNDALRGTTKADVLIGDAGDDVMWVSGSGDRLHGGDGDDVAVFPGFLEDYEFHKQNGLLLAIGHDTRTWLYNVEKLRFSG